MSEPDVRQNASQLSMDILVSDERPMALRKSCGVDILSGAKLIGMRSKKQALTRQTSGTWNIGPLEDAVHCCGNCSVLTILNRWEGTKE